MLFYSGTALNILFLSHIPRDSYKARLPISNPSSLRAGNANKGKKKEILNISGCLGQVKAVVAGLNLT